MKNALVRVGMVWGSLLSYSETNRNKMNGLI